MFFTALVFGLAQAALAVTPTTTVPPLILSGRQSTRPPGTYSAGIADIIKLLDAKVDAPVILAYIQNSPIPYNPEATELIALKDHGASTETLVALLHHGDELRLQLAHAQSAANPPPAAPAYISPGSGRIRRTRTVMMLMPPTCRIPPLMTATLPVGPWLTGRQSVSAGTEPYGYAHGRYYPRGRYGYHAGDGGHRNWACCRPPRTHRNRYPPPAADTRVLRSCILVARGVQAVLVGGREAGRVS